MEQQTPKSRPPVKKRQILAVIATILCVGLALWLRYRGDSDHSVYYGQWVGKAAPDFSLTDQDGKRLELADLRGKLVLMTFGFTHCPNICPTSMAHLAAIWRGLTPAEQQRVTVLFITVDPDRDKPAALGEYVRFYSPSFLGATGSTEDIAKVAKGYGAYYEAVMQESSVANDYYTINHSAYIYLIDPAGRFALLYNNDKLTDHVKMQGDIERVLAAGGA